MPVFPTDARTTGNRDYQLAQLGFVLEYRSREVLTTDEDWFECDGYDVQHVSATGWDADVAFMHDSLSPALDFPAYYGRNLDALDDDLGDVAVQDYGVQEGSTGLVLVVDEAGGITGTTLRSRMEFADPFADAARVAALHGNRMICLIDASGPDAHPRPSGFEHWPRPIAPLHA